MSEQRSEKQAKLDWKLLLNWFGLKRRTWREADDYRWLSAPWTSPPQTHVPCVWTDSVKAGGGVWGGQMTVNYTVRCRGGRWDGGLDKHMVGTTNVVSFMHNDSSAASRTSTLLLQPDTLLQTYLCVCTCAYVCVRFVAHTHWRRHIKR